MEKVCHITIAHRRKDVRIFERECVALKEEGYKVVLLVNDQEEDKEENGVTIVSANAPLGGKIKRLNAVMKLYKMALEIDAQLYHLHEPELLLFAGLLKRKGKKVIFDSHEAYKFQFYVRGINNDMLQNMFRKIYSIFEKTQCKKIDAVIFPGTMRVGGNNNWTPFEGIKEKLVLVANYPKAIKDIHIDTLKEKKEFKICYTGALAHERGITHLIDACYQARVPLILAGRFITSAYEKELRSKESFACVDYRGICTREEVYSIYEEASLGASILLDRGQYNKLNVLATKVYEYFQCRLPVLVNSYPYVDELNEKYQFGYSVNPEDIEEIVLKILEIKSSPEKAVCMGRNGYELYVEMFTWEKEKNNLIDLYGNILQRR